MSADIDHEIEAEVTRGDEIEYLEGATGHAIGSLVFLVFRVDPRVAAFEGSLVAGYLLRIWEKMSIYERILEGIISQEAETQVASEVEEQVKDVDERIEREVDERIAEEVADGERAPTNES